MLELMRHGRRDGVAVEESLSAEQPNGKKRHRVMDPKMSLTRDRGF